MKIESSQVTKLLITDLDALDSVTVIAEDLEPSKGKITITCYGKAWTAYWGGMGGRTIAEFFCSCDEEYITSYLIPDIRKTNKSDRLYLHRIIKAVQEALAVQEVLEA